MPRPFAGRGILYARLPYLLAQVVLHALVVVTVLGARWPIVRASGRGRRWVMWSSWPN